MALPAASEGMGAYFYTSGETNTVDGVDDAREWGDTKQKLEMLGLGGERQDRRLDAVRHRRVAREPAVSCAGRGRVPASAQARAVARTQCLAIINSLFYDWSNDPGSRPRPPRHR